MVADHKDVNELVCDASIPWDVSIQRNQNGTMKLATFSQAGVLRRRSDNEVLNEDMQWQHAKITMILVMLGCMQKNTYVCRVFLWSL